MLSWQNVIVTDPDKKARTASQDCVIIMFMLKSLNNNFLWSWENNVSKIMFTHVLHFTFALYPCQKSGKLAPIRLFSNTIFSRLFVNWNQTNCPNFEKNIDEQGRSTLNYLQKVIHGQIKVTVLKTCHGPAAWLVKQGSHTVWVKPSKNDMIFSFVNAVIDLYPPSVFSLSTARWLRLKKSWETCTRPRT